MHACRELMSLIQRLLVLCLFHRNINFQLQKERVVNALKENATVCFLSFFKASLIEKRQYEILSMLDQGTCVT